MQQYFFLLGSSGELAIQTVLVIMTIYFVSIHCTSQYFLLEEVSDTESCQNMSGATWLQDAG